MKKKSNSFLWLFLIAVILGGSAYVYSLTQKNARSKATFNLSSEVRRPIITGQMERLVLFEPRKSMPAGVFLEDLNKTTNLQNLKGQWTLVNLWASWCPPCLRELPSLQRLNDAYSGQGFRVVAISLDSLSSPSELNDIIATRRLGSIARNWDHTGELFKLITNVANNGSLPTSFILDPDGKVYAQMNGEAEWATLDGLDMVDSLLGRKSLSGPSK